jgi:hypothetical protein
MDLTRRFAEAKYPKSLSVKELPISPFEIVKVTRKSTKLGEPLPLTLKNKEDIFSVFLPKRYVRIY